MEMFLENPAEFKDPASVVVRIPAGLRSKQKLFTVLADKLRFPAYFGWNWDALEECLRDLSWLPPEMGIAIVHDGLPFGSGGQNRGIYLAVLRSALMDVLNTCRLTKRGGCTM